MMSLADLIQQGTGNMWLFVPAAVLLGVLHGLEPGHSKTMIAAFIIAIRGTVAQAALLGLSATISHTAIVWIVALAGMYFGPKAYSPASEPYFQIASGIIIVAIALWILFRVWRQQRYEHAHSHRHDAAHGHDLPGSGWQDAHDRAHARDLERHFANHHVTAKQIVLFGLTGGLIPCPAAITVLLVCLQLRHFTLGAALVLCFSIGLAITMVGTGAIAALSVRHVRRRWPGLGDMVQRAPYASGTLILLVGLFVAWEGVQALVPS